MKIAIDLDGTATKHIEFFSEFMKAMQIAGHEVGILTGHNISSESIDVQFLVTHNFSEPDFYLGKTNEERGTPNKLWKKYMMYKHDIDYLFDNWDSPNLFLTDKPSLKD